MTDKPVSDLSKSAPPDEKRCKAVTAKGERCKRPRIEGSDYCEIHSEKHPMGAKKFTDERKQEFIRHIEEGHAQTISSAAALTGVNRTTVYKATKEKYDTYDPDFAAAYERAKGIIQGEYEKTLYESATGEAEGQKTPYWPALRFALVNMSKNGEWEGEKHQEINVNQSQTQKQEENSVDYEKAKEELEGILDDVVEESSDD